MLSDIGFFLCISAHQSCQCSDMAIFRGHYHIDSLLFDPCIPFGFWLSFLELILQLLVKICYISAGVLVALIFDGHSCEPDVCSVKLSSSYVSDGWMVHDEWIFQAKCDIWQIGTILIVNFWSSILLQINHLSFFRILLNCLIEQSASQ
jgi:hypothetical protein